jgi:cation:H+ antiporter
MSVAKGITDLGIGNLIGAAATDLTLALGLVYVIAKKEKVKDKMNWILMGFIAAAMVLLLIFGRDNLLARWEGALMLGVYTIYQIIILRKGFQSNSNKFSTRKLIVPYVLVPLSLISILLGAFLVVDTGIALATLAGISAAAIGLTVVSIGTTAPELIEGVISARSGHKEMAVGSVLGGAVVCTLLILSLTAAIFSLKISYSSFIFPSIFVLALVAYNVIYTAIRKQTDKILGASLIAAYFGYLAIVLI